MKKVDLLAHIVVLLFIGGFVASCSRPPGAGGVNKSQPAATAVPNAPQIDQYVVAAFQDSKGNLWFGTLSNGVARYDGATLTYLSEKDGLIGNTVTGIAEDRNGHIWLGSHSGLSRYDGLTVTNFTEKDGLCNNRVANVLIDKTGTLWIGTWGGVSRWDGKAFSTFPLPVPDVAVQPYQNTLHWVTEIFEDHAGNLWFGRDGYGACRYDGHSFTQFTKKDGLPSNNVQAIREDHAGNIWFGCRVTENDHPDPNKRTGDGGLCRYDGHTFARFPEQEGLSRNDVYTIYTDKKGNVWAGATRVGLYKYDGTSFQVYKSTNRMDLTYSFGVQAILEDQAGRLWLGFSGGLFRLIDSSIVNVTQNGPWQ